MIVTDWTGVEVKALWRVALRLTQEEFAERIGYAPVTIRGWQHATAERPVRGKSAQDLDTELARLNGDQAERFWAAVGGASVGVSRHPGGDEADDLTSQSDDALGIYAWEVDGDVRRREFGRLAAVTGAAAVVGSWEIRGDRIGTADVRQLLKCVGELEREDQRAGGAPLVVRAVRELATAKNRLNMCSFSTDTARALTSAVGELAVLTGWLAVDADMHPLARRCYSDAMALASEADNPDLTAHTCLYVANQSIALSRVGKASPHNALKLISRARDLMRGRPPGRIHALIATRQAQAASLLGDRDAFGRAIATAWREVDQAVEYEPLEECPPWLQSFNHAEVRGHEARGYGTVGEFSKAVDLLEAAASEQTMVRNALNTRACLASARVAAGDMSGALAEAEPILIELDNTVSSPRTVRTLAPVRRAAESLPAAAEFRRQFDALAKAAVTA